MMKNFLQNFYAKGDTMPGFRTHYLFGRTTREELAGSYPALRKYPHSYNLGQQGPDIFFYCPPSHIFYKEHLG